MEKGTLLFHIHFVTKKESPPRAIIAQPASWHYVTELLQQHHLFFKDTQIYLWCDWALTRGGECRKSKKRALRGWKWIIKWMNNNLKRRIQIAMGAPFQWGINSRETQQTEWAHRSCSQITTLKSRRVWNSLTSADWWSPASRANMLMSLC